MWAALSRAVSQQIVPSGGSQLATQSPWLLGVVEQVGSGALAVHGLDLRDVGDSCETVMLCDCVGLIGSDRGVYDRFAALGERVEPRRHQTARGGGAVGPGELAGVLGAPYPASCLAFFDLSGELAGGAVGCDADVADRVTVVVEGVVADLHCGPLSKAAAPRL